ncbi:MAG: hypothetical protein KC731_27705 [Myxococcales bacterium]|nr:hypothetical protein [Myxococcales bacterium]
MRRGLVVVLLLALAVSGCTRAGMEAGALALRLVLAGLVLLRPFDGVGAGSKSHAPDWDQPFDAEAADGVMNAVTERIGGCGRHPGPTGFGVVCLRAEPDGTLAEAWLSERFAGTPVGVCIVDEIRASGFKPFRGDAELVCRSFEVDGRSRHGFVSSG